MTPSGPRVVAVGGGHGLAATLRAARRYAGELTAIVSVADDGGSSGRLRRQLGIAPPGDLRKCLVAMAEPMLLQFLGDRESAQGRLDRYAEVRDPWLRAMGLMYRASHASEA